MALHLARSEPEEKKVLKPASAVISCSVTCPTCGAPCDKAAGHDQHGTSKTQRQHNFHDGKPCPKHNGRCRFKIW